MRRAEEGLRRGSAPVDEEPAATVVGEAEPPDVDGSGVVGPDDAAEADVEAEALEGAQATRQAMDLLVALEGSLSRASRGPACCLEAVGEVGGRAFEGGCDGGEVPLVVGDQRRVGLGGEVVGQGEGVGGQWAHVISSDRGFRPRPMIVRQDGGLAAIPPLRYTLEVEGGRILFTGDDAWAPG
jgi:hypothetical protein